MKNDKCPYTALNHVIKRVRDDDQVVMHWCPNCGATRQIIKSRQVGPSYLSPVTFAWELPAMAIDLLTESQLTDDEKQMAHDNKIMAIKMVRQRTGLCLSEAMKKVQFYLLYRKPE